MYNPSKLSETAHTTCVRIPRPRCIRFSVNIHSVAVIWPHRYLWLRSLFGSTRRFLFEQRIDNSHNVVVAI
jgi:hypothetical protein